MSRASERAAAEMANKILKAAHGSGNGDLEGDTSYGAGKLTKDQRKSQEQHIPMTPGPQTTGQRVWRNLFG